MNPVIRNAIARIDVMQQGKSISRGTGCLVADGLVLTALHVVADRIQPSLTPYPGEIVLTFPSGTVKASIHENYWDRLADFALLHCETQPDIRPVPLAELHEDGAAWETYGFPDANPRDGMANIGEVSNCLGTLEGNPVFQLFSREAAAGQGAPVKGLSGSPVIVQNAVVGLLRFALMKEGLTVAGTVYACPIASVLEKAGHLLPLPDPCFGLPGLPRLDLPTEPFRYLSWFTEKEAEVFFGRNREIRQMYDRLTADDASPIVLFYGQSGVGKSSFLDAGLVPRLRVYYQVCYLRRDAHATLSTTLRDALILLGGEPTESAPDLAAAWGAVERNGGKPLVVFFDQVEEVYTHVNTESPNELQEFAREIGKLFAGSTSRGRLVLSFRKEWLPEIEKQIEQNHLDCVKVFLEGLDGESVVEAVTGLNSTTRLHQHYGLKIQPGLAARISAELLADRGSPIAPTLQILLTKMWRKATAISRSAPEWTVAQYQALKEEGLLLSDFLDQQLDALAAVKLDPEGKLKHAPPTAVPEDWVKSGFALDVLTYHTTALGTSKECPLDDLLRDYSHRAADIPALLQEMQALFLLSDTSRDDARQATRLSHDTLAPVVRQRYATSENAAQRARRILEGRAEDWKPGAQIGLLDDGSLEAVEAGAPGMRKPTDKEKALVDASRVQQRKRQFNRQALRIGAAVVLVAIVTLSVAAGVEGVKAVKQERLAATRLTISDSLRLLDAKPAEAAMLAVAGLARSLRSGKVEAPAQQAVFRAMSEAREENLLYTTESAMNRIDWSADGQIAITEWDKAQGVWDIDLYDGHAQQRIKLTQLDTGKYQDPIPRFSPDGKFVAVGATEGILILDKSGTPVKALNTPARVLTLSFTTEPNDYRLVAGVELGRVQTWNARWEPLWDVAYSQKIDEALVSAAGHYPNAKGEMAIVTGGSDGKVKIWSEDGKPIRTLPKAAKPIGDLLEGATRASGAGIWNLDTALGPGGNSMIAYLIGQGTVVVWSEKSEKEFPFVNEQVCDLKFSPRGDLLAISLDDGAVRFLDPATGAQTMPDLHGLEPVFCPGLAFSPSGDKLAVRQLWTHIADLQTGPVLQTLRGEESTSSSDAIQFSPDGTLLAALMGNRIYLWETRTGLQRAWNVAEDPMVMMFDRDSTRLLTGNMSGDLQVWGMDGRLRQEKKLAGAISNMGLSADGGTVLASIVAKDSKPSIQAWHRQSNEVRPLWPAGAGPPAGESAAAFSKDGTKIATGLRRGTGDAVQVWNADGSAVTEFPLPASFDISTMRFSPDGKEIVIMDKEGDLSFWSLEGNRLAPHPPAGGGHKSTQNFFGLPAFHAGGDTYFRAGPSVGVFDRATGEEFAEFTAPDKDMSHSIAISPDGKQLASLQLDGTVRIWRATWKEWLEVTCNRLRNHPILQERSSDRIERENIQLTKDTCQELVWSKAK